jgi:hypothetical protein
MKHAIETIKTHRIKSPFLHLSARHVDDSAAAEAAAGKDGSDVFKRTTLSFVQ